jgi:hypothetical protein
MVTARLVILLVRTLILFAGGVLSDVHRIGLGVAVLLANWTRSDLSDLSFAQDDRQQLVYLTSVAPRTADGAISHRNDQVQLWADFVYMAPPFIAYYGALAGGSSEATLMQDAYDQCRLYRNYLRDDPGLWRHIVLGNGEDARHWGTGTFACKDCEKKSAYGSV